MKVVIIGAGVIGMMTARELARGGCEVVILDKSQAGGEASWAGGGIVSPLYPWRYSAPVTALASVAQQAYPLLAAELAKESGFDPELSRSGLLMLDAEDARDAVAWAAMHRHQLLQLDKHDLQCISGLAEHWKSGLWMPDIANIRNPRLLKALKMSLELAGVTICEQEEVTHWQGGSDVASAVVSKGGRQYEADVFVVCSGAWSRHVLDAAGVAALSVRPVRGQMLLYKLASGAPQSIVMADGRYVIPRRDGHVLCGSTLEETGFDKSTTMSAFLSLKASAERLWPVLAEHQPIAHWAGLRPGAPNGIPFIGRVPGKQNVWVNAGQFRNGLVLAPASARLLADQLLSRQSTIDVRPYQLM